MVVPVAPTPAGTASTDAVPLLSAERLVRSHGGRTVLDVDRIELRGGEVLAVVGPNGAGKSTLFRLLLLLERPDSGTIRVRGEVVRAGGPRPAARLAGVFQRPILFTGAVADNVGFGLRAQGVPRHERETRVAEALRWLELEPLAAAPVHGLSGGEAQRVALARALVLEPDVLLLDEPTASLDVSARRRFRRDLEQVARQHASGIILITHDAGEALGLADRIVVLHHGRVVQDASPEQIVLQPGTPFVAELTGAELLLHGTVTHREDGLCRVALGRAIELWAATAEAAEPAVGGEAVIAYRPEDVFLAIDEVAETSAANRVDVTVEAIVPAGALVRVLLHVAGAPGVVLTALLTRRSAEALHLVRGTHAVAHLKATALHAWGRSH
jgi:molybdopterin-binding protein